MVKRENSRLKGLCGSGVPTRASVDPSYFAKHSTFDRDRKRAWSGFGEGHPLREVSSTSLDLFNRTVEARHNLIYRPFMLQLDGTFLWEDCTLENLLADLPSTQEVRAAYDRFIADMRQCAIEEWKGNLSWPDRVATNILELLHRRYADVNGDRPTEGIFLTYARMLRANDEQALRRAEEWWQAWLDAMRYEVRL